MLGVRSNPWWSIAGFGRYKRVLVTAPLGFNQIDALREFSGIVYTFDPVTLVIDRKCTPQSNDDNLEEGFDLLIINDLDGKLEKSDRLRTFVDRYLVADGQVLLLEANPIWLKRLIRHPFDLVSNLIRGGRESQIRSMFGVDRIRRYETISYLHGPFEAYSPNRYYTNKNCFLVTERIKKVLLNSPFSRLFYNSMIWIASRASENSDLIDECVKKLTKLEGLSWQGSQVRLLKIYFKFGKMLFSLTSREDWAPEFVVVFPMDHEHVERRENERLIVRQLRAEGIANEFMIPRITSAKVGRFPVFVMDELPGMTVDAENSRIEKMTRNAYEALKQITCPLSDMSCDANSVRTSLFEEWRLSFNRRYPAHMDLYEQVSSVREFASDLPLVNFFHGDLKLENFMVDKDTAKIVGIIDFEQSIMPGPGLLDLYYLISYNHETIDRGSFAQSYTKLVENSHHAFYRDFIEDYCASFGITNRQRQICLVAFLIHHLSKRMFVDVNNAEHVALMRTGFNLAENVLRDLKVESAEF